MRTQVSPKNAVLDAIGLLCHVSARNNKFFNYGRGFEVLDMSEITPKEIKLQIYQLKFHTMYNCPDYFDEKFFRKYAGTPFFR